MNRITPALLGLVVAAATTAVFLAQDTEERLDERPLAGVIAEPGQHAAAAGSLDNPSVDPGGVAWHADLAAARAASADSGRPVLLFQLLGRLDQEFC